MKRTDDWKQGSPPDLHGGRTLGSAADEPGQVMAPPRQQGRGIIWWGAFLLLMSIWPLFSRPLSPGPGLRFEEFGHARVAASGSYAMKGLQVVGGVIAFALCLWWYRLAARLASRGVPFRILGGVAFLLGTLYLPVVFGMPGQMQVVSAKLGGESSVAGLILPLLFGLVGCGLLVLVARLLRFKRDEH